MNPLFNAYATSDLFGKLIFQALFLLSIITWVIFIQKYFQQRSARFAGTSLVSTFKKKAQGPLNFDLKEAMHPYAAIYQNLKQHAIELLNKNRYALGEGEKVCLSRSDIELLQSHMHSSISSESKKLERKLFILSTVVSLAPFLGLLGTVWGILLTFAELQSGGSVNANATIMGGLAMALGTTVLGLLVAIPALIAYNYLRASTRHFTAEMEDFAQLLVGSVELHYRKVDL